MFSSRRPSFQTSAPELDSAAAEWTVAEVTAADGAGQPSGDAGGEVQAFVEVAPPGGGGGGDQQYAIVMCVSGDEPEAAMSMLQLQAAVGGGGAAGV